MILISIIVSCAAMYLPTSLCTHFPEVLSPEHVNVRLKNVASKSYLNVRKNTDGEYQLSTKFNASLMDPDVDFSLYLFTSAEAGETKFGLIRHQETGLYISMTHNKKVQLSFGSSEDPSVLTIADHRFFFIQKVDEYFVFSYLNDDDSRHKYYLGVNVYNEPVFRKYTRLSSHYSADILFSIEELDGK